MSDATSPNGDNAPLPPVDPAALRTEVVDRLRMIGTLAEHVAQDRMDMGLALEVCSRLLAVARSHHDLSVITEIDGPAE